MKVKKLDSQLVKSCHDYLMSVEPIPQGDIAVQGTALVAGLVEGEFSESGGILYLQKGERPSVEQLAHAQAICFESSEPDEDLVALCYRVGLTAIGKINKPVTGTVLVDGLRGNIHLPGPIKQGTGSRSWESKINVSLPVPIHAAIDFPEEVTIAKRRGACGIGLVRTEHLCQTPDLLPLLQQLMLLESGPLAERRGLDLAEGLSEKFIKIFEEAPEGPVTIRFFDPPMHEFLDMNAITSLQSAEGPNFKALFEEKDSIAPTLINRGMRIGWKQPALMTAFLKSLDLASSQVPREFQIALPMVSTEKEILKVREALKGRNWKIGAMIETPAALSQAPSWLPHVDFLSIGGNDLVQSFWGFSRDDRRDLYHMVDEGLMPADPFGALDPHLLEHLKPCIQAAHQASKPINFCGLQATHLPSAEMLITSGISSLTTDVDHLVPLRLQLSGAFEDPGEPTLST